MAGPGSSAWRTPAASDGEGGIKNLNDPKYRDAKCPQIKLRDHAGSWPTPKTITGGANSKREERGAGGPDLQESAKNWPTPAARDYKGLGGAVIRKDGKSRMSQLDCAAENFDLFHRARPASESGPRDPKKSKNGSESLPAGRNLNPLFVEWLMGWPIGWTGSDFAETEWSRWWRLWRSWLYERGFIGGSNA
jgi:hypothetical protein